MNEHDEKRFAAMIRDFVESCGFARPFHLITIDSKGSCTVTRHRSGDRIEQICSGPEKWDRLHMAPPPIVTAISGDGVGRSAKIPVEAAREWITLQ